MTKQSVRINEREINEHVSPFIIAEAGVNHNGELEKALALVDLATNIGADAVKFQTFRTDEVVTDDAQMAAYQQKNLGRKISQKEMIKAFELPESDWPKIVKRCRENNILFLSTPHGGVQSVDLLESLNVVAYKIGSADVTNYILLDRIAKTRKPIIISSGMSDLQELSAALKFLLARQSGPLVALHCTTSYPCPIELTNLGAMKNMMSRLKVPVGFSDHTLDHRVAQIATILGMALYEFHITLDNYLPGPDHLASANPAAAATRIQAIKTVETLSLIQQQLFIKSLGDFYSTAIGSHQKKPTKPELEIAQVARKSLVASRDIRQAEVLNVKDIKAKRPGTGVSPIYFEQFIGKKLLHSRHKDEQLQFSDIYETA